jgi:hypothetical protein
LYDVGSKSYSNRNEKQKALNEMAEKLPTTAVNLAKLSHNQLFDPVVRVITPHDATQLVATDTEMFRTI